MSSEDERGVPLECFHQDRDVYIIYSFEDVAFFWEQAIGIVRRRFPGEVDKELTDHTNRLFNDAQMGGRLATREEYENY